MDNDHIRRINSISCPIPQYNEMGRKWGEWVAKNTTKNTTKNSTKKGGK